MSRIASSPICPIFSVVFVLAYLISLEFHPRFTIFAYAPRLGTWFLGAPNLGADGPAMCWWSFLATAFIAGLVISPLVLLVRKFLFLHERVETARFARSH